jgi:hypothetical protein
VLSLERPSSLQQQPVLPHAGVDRARRGGDTVLLQRAHGQPGPVRVSAGPSTVSVVAHGWGLDVAVVAPEPEVADIMASLPVGFAVSFEGSADVARTYEVTRGAGVDVSVRADGALVGGPGARPDVLRGLRDDLERFATEHSPTHVFVHAGVVAVDGRAVFLPGASGAGKTSAVVALVTAGAEYLSDEFGVIDAALGVVHPYPRPLQVRAPGARSPKVVEPSSLGTVCHAPVPLGAVVLTWFDATRAWNPEPVAPGMALLAMLQHTVPTRRDPARVLRVLAGACESVPVVESARGDAATFAAALLASPPWR